MKRNLQVVLHGGDGKLEEQLKQIIDVIKSSQGNLFLSDKSVAYVAAALEPIVGQGKPIPAGGLESTLANTIKPIFDAESISKLDLITSANIRSLFNYDVVVFSGGDTHYLLEVLAKAGIAEVLKAGGHSIKSVAGISAGAIALARQGIGTKDGKVTRFDGMGLFDVTVVVHTDKYPERKQINPEAIALGAKTYSGLFILQTDQNGAN